ncbi:MAG: hypothetical protein HQ453_10460 [Actinobacteria bacterium]|nr:hypothetical protein [Actinomycetota bacterium]
MKYVTSPIVDVCGSNHGFTYRLKIQRTCVARSGPARRRSSYALVTHNSPTDAMSVAETSVIGDTKVSESRSGNQA